MNGADMFDIDDSSFRTADMKVPVLCKNTKNDQTTLPDRLLQYMVSILTTLSSCLKLLPILPPV